MKILNLLLLGIILALSASLGVCAIYEAQYNAENCSILCGCGGGGDGCNCTVFRTGGAAKACDCKNCGCGNVEALPMPRKCCKEVGK